MFSPPGGHILSNRSSGPLTVTVSLSGLKIDRFAQFGFEFSLSAAFGFRMEKGLEAGSGSGENRKLSASRPAMSSHELMTSGSDRRGFGSDQSDLGSERELGKMDPRVNREGGLGGVVGVEQLGGGGSRVRRP